MEPTIAITAAILAFAAVLLRNANASCIAAGYIGCCPPSYSGCCTPDNAGYCNVGCWCDRLCHQLNDCCSDICSAPVTCGSLSVPSGTTGGLTVSVSGTTVGSTATYSCSYTGYYLVGGSSRTCQSSGSWSGSQPYCQIVSCGVPNLPSSGTTGLSLSYTGTTYNSVATYSCATGYNRIGSSTRTCLSSGSWSGSPAYCQIVSCGGLSVPSGSTGGLAVTVPNTIYNSVATYYCSQTGYQLIGQSQRTCQSNGVWSGSQPYCQIISCGTPSQPNSGTTGLSISYSSTVYNSVATYSCATGYNLIGTSTRTCLSSGSWSGSPAYCQIVNCGGLSVPSGSTGGLAVTVPNTIYNSVATYYCSQTGYQLIGQSQRTCQSNGVWSGSQPYCQIISCGAPGQPSSGTTGLSISYSSTVYNSVATYSCATGYNRIGSSTRVCQASGSWSGSPAYCQIVNCGGLSVPSGSTGGLTVTVPNTIYNSVVTYQCTIIGYELIGLSTRTCTSSGIWSGSQPYCQLVNCGPLSTSALAVGGLTVSAPNTVYNSVAVYICAQVGFDLIGQAQRICTAGGTWSGTEPFCQTVDCGSPGINMTTTSLIGLATVQYSSTLFNSTAVYSCDTGYYLVGEPIRVCQASGMWSFSFPTCILHDCGQLSVPPGNLGSLVVSFMTTLYNSTADYACTDLGFVLIGAAQRQCGPDGLWAPPRPHCEPIPLNVTGSDVTDVTFRLSWLLPPTVGNIINHYVIRITELITGKVSTFFSVEATVTITNLHPYYYYNCQVALASTFIHPFANPVIIRTLEAAPSASPLNPSFSNLTTHSVHISWYPPPLEHQNGVIKYYIVTVNEAETGSTYSYTSNHTSILLNTLHPHYNYKISFAAFTIAEGPSGSSISIVTLEDAPTDVPSNFTGYVVDSNTITVSWAPPPPHHHNGIIRMYIIDVMENETGNSFSVVSLNTSATIAPLHPDYHYLIAVRAVTVLPGPVSSSVILRTDEDIPSGTPRDFAVVSITSTSAVLSWNPPSVDEQNGIITGYVINVTLLATGESYLLSSNTTTLLVDILRPFRKYLCIVAAETGVGTGPFGTQIEVQTPQDAPDAPPSTTTSLSVGSTTFTIHWSPPPPYNQNGVIKYYIVTITEIETGVVFQYNTTSLSLSLQSLHPAYTYQYSIAAYTIGLGPFSPPKTIKLNEGVPISPPGNFSNITLSPTNVTFSWNPLPPPDRNGIIISYVLNITLLATGQVFQYTSTSTSITITGLQPFSSYSCLIAAATAVGLGPFTTVLSLTTPEDAPNSSPVLMSTYAVNSKTVVLHYAPPSSEDHNGIIRKYVIRVTSHENGLTFQRESLGTLGVVTSLTPAFTYNFSVSAYTVSPGPYSSVATITMPEDVPSAPPQGLSGAATSATSISLSWNSPPVSQQNGDIIRYIVNVTHSGTHTTLQYNTTATHLNITNLEPYTTYICVVAAETSIGIGPFSVILIVQTEESVPSASPEHASGVSGGPNTIHLAWDPPLIEHHNGEIDGYRINITEDETGTMFQHLTNQTQITINNLHPFYTYHCYITAVTVGEGPYTDAVTIITDEAAPSAPPQSVSESVQSSSGVFIQWASPPPPDVNGIIRSYTVNLLNTRTGAVLSYSTTQTSINITNLSPYTQYQYNVSAVTVSEGPFSISLNFTTYQDVPTSAPENFNVSASSSSTLLLYWDPPSISSANGVIQSYLVIVIEQLSDTVVQNFSTTNTQLQVSGLHPYYIYICGISAVTIGSGPVANFTIQMPEDVPDSAPTSVQSTAVTSTSIDIDWDSLPTENENGIVRHYIVNVTEVQTGNTFQIMSSDESATLTNLHPAYQYTLTVAAYTVGLGPYSTVLTVTTLEDAPSSAPTSLSSSVQGPTSVLLTWSPPPVADQNGVITLYTVEVINTATSDKDVYVTSTNTLTVASLAPHTTYKCAVAANTSVGLGPYSTYLVFQTDEDVPVGAPEDVSVEAPSSTTLSIEWMAPPQDDQNGIIRSYVVRVLEVVTSTTMTYNTTEESLTVGFLHPHYQYEVSVAAVTVGQGPFSDSVTIQTPQDAPSGPPAAINVSSLSSTSLFISWSPPLPEHVNGIIQHYIVNVTVTESQEKLQYQTASTSLTLNNLHPFYTHTVIVLAVTVAPGPFSSEYILRLPPDAPSGPPQNINGSVISSTSLQLSWSPPAAGDHNGLIQSYTIRVFEQQTNSTVVVHQNFQENMIIITSLHPYYDYTLSVAAHTVALGPYGSVTLTTSQEAPSGPPQNLSTIITSSRSVTLQWTPPRSDQQNGVIQHYIIQVVVAQTAEVLQHTSTGQSLTLTALHPYYTYTCTIAAVTVASGPSTLVTFTMPQDIPTGPPLNISVLPLNSTSLYASWRPPQNELQNGIIVGYSILLHEVETASTQIISSVMGLSAIVTSLHPSYTYEVQIAAVTTGVGPYSLNVQSQLPEDSPSGSPTGVSGFSNSPYSITVTWATPVPGLLNGAVTGYIINVTHSNTLQTVQYTSNTTTLVVSDLEPYTRYICVVAAETSVGAGPFSHLILIQTDETAPSGAPEYASGIPVGSTSIHLTWDPPSLQHQNGLIRQYLINISEPISGYWNQTSTDQTQVTITDLLPHRTYTCHVAAVTVAVGPYTQSIMVVTSSDAPTGPPLNLSSTINSSTSVNLMWNPPHSDLQNGFIQFYLLQLITVEETGLVLQYTSVNPSLTITDLHPHYSYTCTIAAVTVAPGPAETIMFQMPEDVPSGFPENVTAHALNTSAMQISWLAPSPDSQNGIIRQYRFCIIELETGNVSCKTVENILQTTVTNLHPYYSYQVRVAAVTVGIGPYSTEVTLQLPEAEPSESPYGFVADSSDTTTAHLQWSPLSGDKQNGELAGYEVMCSSENGHMVTVQVSGTSITLADLQANNIYTCLLCAFTSVGCGPTATAYFSTYRDSPVGPPKDVMTTNVSATSAVLEWEPPFDPENFIDTYSVTYQLMNTSFPFAVPRPPVTIYSISTTSFTLQTLLESSVYRIVVNAIADNATSSDSEPLLVTTTKPDFFSSGDFKCPAVSYSQLSCSWSVPALTDHVVSEYTIHYKLAEGYDYFPEYGNILETPLKPHVRQYTIGSLQPSAGYLVILEATLSPGVDGSGSGDFLLPEDLSNATTIMITTSIVNITLPDVPSGAVRNLSVNLTSATSVYLSWVPPERNLWKGEIDHYLVMSTNLGPARGVRKRQAPSSTFAVMVPPQANHRDPSLALETLKQENYELLGLEEYFQYSITVSLVNAAGTGPQHPPILQYMPEAAPSGPPVDIGATATTSSVTVTWSPPSPLEANGLIVGYTLQLTRVRYGGRTETHSLSGTTLDFRKNGLTANEPVLIRIAASTEQGLGPFSENLTFTTMEASPSAPQSVTARLIDRRSILVFWREPQFANGLLQEYQVIYTIHDNVGQSDQEEKQQQFVISTGVDVHNVTVTDTTPGIYEFKVRARNGAGYGVNSSSAIVIVDDDPTTQPTQPPTTIGQEVAKSISVLPIIVPVVVVVVVVVIVVVFVIIIVIYIRRSSKSAGISTEYELPPIIRNPEDSPLLEKCTVLEEKMEPLASGNEYDTVGFNNTPGDSPSLDKCAALEKTKPSFVISNEYAEVNFNTPTSSPTACDIPLLEMASNSTRASDTHEYDVVTFDTISAADKTKQARPISSNLALQDDYGKEKDDIELLEDEET